MHDIATPSQDDIAARNTASTGEPWMMRRTYANIAQQFQQQGADKHLHDGAPSGYRCGAGRAGIACDLVSQA